MKKLALAVLFFGSIGAHAQGSGTGAQGATAFDDTKVCRYGDSFYTEGAHIKASDGSKLVCEEKDRVIVGNDPVPLHWAPVESVNLMK